MLNDPDDPDQWERQFTRSGISYSGFDEIRDEPVEHEYDWGEPPNLTEFYDSRTAIEDY